VHVLSVSSLKGGVGKTTVTLGLASAAMNRGLRTLVIDLDPQCNATHGLGAIGDFDVTSAEVIRKPRHNVVLKAILSSTWTRGASQVLDVLPGSGRIAGLDRPNPRHNELWRLDQALTALEADYDLILIDTPPSINALTRLAWVASDRTLLVAEPSLNSVVAVRRAVDAFEIVRRKINPQIQLFGVLVNRLRSALPEHNFRVNELDELFGELILSDPLEERSAVQQAQGAARSIHSWPGQNAAKVAKRFDGLLDEVIASFAKDDISRIAAREGRTAKAPKNRRARDRDRSIGLVEANKAAVKKDPRQFVNTRTATAIVIEQPEQVVDPKYQSVFEESLRQSMTEKQIKQMRKSIEIKLDEPVAAEDFRRADETKDSASD
jgi:cellulose biosynthesis protein BcsQ